MTFPHYRLGMKLETFFIHLGKHLCIILEIIAQVNDTIPVGDVIARIGNADEKPDSSSEKVSQSEHVAEIEKK